MANDVDTLLDILAPNYTLTNVNKEVMTLAVYRAYLNLRKKAPRDTTQYKTQIKKLSLHSQLADVDSIETMVTKNKTQVSIHKHEYLDKWVHTNKVWKLSSSMTIKETTTTKRLAPLPTEL